MTRAYLEVERWADGPVRSLLIVPRGPDRYTTAQLMAPQLMAGFQLGPRWLSVALRGTEQHTIRLDGVLDPSGDVMWTAAWLDATEVEIPWALEQIGPYVDGLFALYFANLAAGDYTLAEWP